VAITTYSELVTAIGNWLERGDLGERAGEFITLAEAQMNRRLRVRRMEQRDTASIGDEFSALPVGFLAEKSIRLADGGESWELDPQPAEVLDQAPPMTGRPTVYAVAGGEFRFHPAPDKAYGATLTYWKRIPPLTSANPTNWVLEAAPDAYLYGALVQASAFLEDDTGTPARFAALYGEALAGLEAEQRTRVGRLRTHFPMIGTNFAVVSGV
jgi:hypothetical protein